MQENANQNPGKKKLLNENNDNIQKDTNDIEKLIGQKELEMAKKPKQDTDKLPSNLGGNQTNEKETTRNLSDDGDNDLGQEDLPLGFSDRLVNYLNPALKKFTDLTGGLIKDSRSLVDWMLGGPSKGEPMNDPIAKLINSLFKFIGFDKTLKLIQDAIDANRLKDNVVPDGHKANNLQQDKQPAEDLKKINPNLDFDPGAKKMGDRNSQDKQFNDNSDLSQALLNDSKQINKSNGKNVLIADNKSSSSAQDPYQVDNANHDMQSENSPMKYKMNHVIRHNGVVRAERLPMPHDKSEPKLYNNTKNDIGLPVKKEAANVPLFDIDNDIDNLENIKPIDDEKIDIELPARSSEHITVLKKHVSRFKDNKTQPKIGGR